MAREAEDQEVLDYFRKMGKTLLKEPSGIDPTLAGLALWAVVKDGDAAMFDEMQKRAESAETPTLRSRYLSALGAFEDPALQKRAMTYALEGPIRPERDLQCRGWVLVEPKRGKMSSSNSSWTIGMPWVKKLPTPIQVLHAGHGRRLL